MAYAFLYISGFCKYCIVDIFFSVCVFCLWSEWGSATLGIHFHIMAAGDSGIPVRPGSCWGGGGGGAEGCHCS